MMSALDGPGSSAITDHPFHPRGEWWTGCRDCGLSEAAHSTTNIEAERAAMLATLTRRCPLCVTARDFGKVMPHPGGCPR
jgi:hypothetical protein